MWHMNKLFPTPVPARAILSVLLGRPPFVILLKKSKSYTFGFQTSVAIATEAVDRLHTTARSHHRVLVVEVMGRHAGWIALETGMAGDAAVTLIPEEKYDINQVATWVKKRFERDQYAIVVVAEGALSTEGDLTGIGD